VAGTPQRPALAMQSSAGGDHPRRRCARSSAPRNSRAAADDPSPGRVAHDAPRRTKLWRHLPLLDFLVRTRNRGARGRVSRSLAKTSGGPCIRISAALLRTRRRDTRGQADDKRHEIGEGDRQDLSRPNTRAKELRDVIHGGEYGPDEQRGQPRAADDRAVPCRPDPNLNGSHGIASVRGSARLAELAAARVHAPSSSGHLIVTLATHPRFPEHQEASK